MTDQRLERAKKKLNSESFRKLTERVNYEDLSVKQRELADVIGVEATLKLCEALGGKSVYIPGNLWFDRQEQDRRIREDFDSGMPTQRRTDRRGLRPIRKGRSKAHQHAHGRSEPGAQQEERP